MRLAVKTQIIHKPVSYINLNYFPDVSKNCEGSRSYKNIIAWGEKNPSNQNNKVILLYIIFVFAALLPASCPQQLVTLSIPSGDH